LRLAADRLGFLAVVLVSSLVYAGLRLAVAGDGPVPIIEVKLTEFTIAMPKTVPLGPVTFSITNAGTMDHNFEVEGQGIEKKFDTPLKPGETRSLWVHLLPGKYTVYCPVDDHEKRGMLLEFTVGQQQSNRLIRPETFPGFLEVFVRAGR
jgi:uncharacterized cupredoxin-like copper-binding protein